MDQLTDKPKLLIIASRAARGSPSSPLLRFVRDHTEILKKFEIYAPAGTGRSIIATGLYKKGEVDCRLSGPEGGVVELAAMVAEGSVLQ